MTKATLCLDLYGYIYYHECASACTASILKQHFALICMGDMNSTS